MNLIFSVDPCIIKIHPCAKFHDPGFIGLDFRGLNPFGVRALEIKKKIKKETNSVKLHKAVLKHLPKYCVKPPNVSCIYNTLGTNRSDRHTHNAMSKIALLNFNDIP